MIKLIYEREIGDYVSAIKFNERGNVLAANMANGCSYIINLANKELLKYCYGVSYDISYLDGVFSFVTFSGVVYTISEKGELINIFQIGSEYSNAIALLREGVMVCNTSCALYSLDGKYLWSVQLNGYVRPGMRSCGNLVYAAVDEGEKSKLITISLDGEVKEIFSISESIFSIDVCDRTIAVGSSTTLTVLDGDSIWRVRGFEGITSLSFSNDCKKIMVADMYNMMITLFKVRSEEEMEIIEEGLTTSMDWRGTLAVGLNNGKVKVYEIVI